MLTFSESEYLNRQSAFLDELPENSLVLIPTNPKSVRSNDTHYPFRANSYMLYLCGWSESDSVWMASNSEGPWKTSLFVLPRDTKAEIWEGRRAGPEGAAENWPVDSAYSVDDLDKEITPLIECSNHIFYISGINPKIDSLLDDSVKEVADPKPYLDALRVIKSDAEIELMRKSAELASQAHILAMRAGGPGVGEWHLQSVIESCFTSNRAQWAYPSIVGGGENAAILHYNSNHDPVGDGDLVLIDAGCEVEGYASDITRTWPVNGSFTDAQREIYELVLKSQIAAIEACQSGARWMAFHDAASRVIAQGLIDLGILDCTLDEAIGNPLEFDGPYRNYFMHGTGHFLGLDVHDVGGGRQGDEDPGPELRPGMIITVEPGLYFGSWRTDVEIPERYAGIGVRIEDDVLITENGPVVLTSSCPKEISAMEAIIGQEG
ncbi:MAG: Xaa-Pro aminopeptidase [Gemmatimonadetes bacterium]|nr:Xaa-Pro aminopeptidase [Gemmatimonadota bacterium]